MASYTIAGKSISSKILKSYYAQIKATQNFNRWDDLDLIFAVALQHRDRFPSINLFGSDTPLGYIERWVVGYVDAVSNLPSLRTANPKSSCTDPSIRVIVKATQGLTDDAAAQGEATHNLFMSAENIQGNLLEEYVALNIRPYGFLWCNGNVLRAIDFCNSNGSLFLQIKNKSNTENSSSSNVRKGTNIKKWYRLGTKSKGRVKIPDYKWDDLNSMINEHKTTTNNLPPCYMSEEDYQNFLTQKAIANHNLITSR